MDGEAKIKYGDGKTALLQATVNVVARVGLRGLTFRAVADEAGVNNTLIAHHFGNREGLLLAAIAWSTTVAIEATGLSEASEHPVDFQRALLRSALSTRSQLVFQYEMILEASRNERFRQPITDLYRSFFRALMLESSTRADALTRARFATIDGLVLQMVAGAITPEEFEESVEAAAEWLWHEQSPSVGEPGRSITSPGRPPRRARA